MKARIALVAVLLVSPSVFGKSQASSVAAADYYYRQHEFRQALPLWHEVLTKDPENILARLRVAEMTLWLEGRSSLPDLFRPAIDSAVSHLPREGRALLKRRYWELQNIFLTDQAQNLYYQGKHRAERGDTRGAWDSLNQAAALDRGQFLILRQRATIEKMLGQYEPYYQTLRLAFKSYPYDPATASDLAEAHLNAKAAAAAVDALRALDSLDANQTLLLAVAMADSGAGTGALPTLRALAARRRGAEASPIVYYSIGQVLWTLPGNEAEAKKWFEKFLEAAPVAAAGWDPFHLAERVADARRALSR